MKGAMDEGSVEGRRRWCGSRALKALLLAVVCAAVAGARPAALRAHGRAPALVSVAPPGSFSSGALLGTSFGVLSQRAPGAPWQWICEEAIGYRPEIAPQLAWLPDGILVATFDGVSISHDEGCSWRSIASFGNRLIAGVALHADAPALVYVATGQASGPNVLFRSQDGGRAFAATRLERDQRLSGVLVSAAARRRVYVAAYRDGTPAVVLRSDDEGDSWHERAHPDAGDPAAPLYLLAVSPTDPDLLFTRLFLARGSSIWRSGDGGQTFAEVLALPLTEEPIGLTFGEDGRTLWLGTTAGLWRSEDAGLTFDAPLAPVARACLGRAGGELYACGDPAVDGWLLARGADREGPWQPLLKGYGEIAGPKRCAAKSAVAQICEPLWRTLAAELGIDAAAGLTPAPSDAAIGAPSDEPVDAAPPSAAAQRPRGAGCIWAPRANGSGGLALAIGLLALARLGRRRAPERRQAARSGGESCAQEQRRF